MVRKLIHFTAFSLQGEYLSVSSPPPPAKKKKKKNITEGHTNCGRVSPGRKSIRAVTNNTLQHGFSIRDVFI